MDLSYGGPSHAVRAMTHALRESGVDITIAATNDAMWERLPRRDSATESARRGVEAAPTFGFPRNLNGILPSSFFFSPGLSRWLDEDISTFDLVHVHTLFNYPSNRACAA